MLPQEFQRGMNQIVKVFKPKDWDQETSDLYFSTVRRWSVSDWEAVVDESLKNSVYMPKPKNLLMTKLDISARIDAERSDSGGSLLGCECCKVGLISFQQERRGVQYDKVCACVCYAGEAQLRKLYGQNRIKSYLEIFGTQPEPVKEPLAEVAKEANFERASEASAEEAVLVTDEYDDSLPF